MNKYFNFSVMGSSQSTSNQVIVPLKHVEEVIVPELQRLSSEIEKTIQTCSSERAILRNTYKTEETVAVMSCTSSFKFEGNHQKTFDLISRRFQGRAKFELKTVNLPDPDDDYRGPAYFYETSVIKVVV